MLAHCDSCSAKFDATGKRPGAVFRCPRCKEGKVTVPADAESPANSEPPEVAATPEPAASPEPAAAAEPAAAPAPRRGAARPSRTRAAGASKRASTRRAAAEPKAGWMSPKVIGIAAAAVVVVGAIAFFATRGGDADPGPGGASAKNGADTNGGSSAGSTKAQASPKDTYQARRAALADDDADGRAALAQFCTDNGMASAATSLRREALLIDPDQDAARTALDFERYTGKARQFQGRWLDKEDRKLAAIAERFVTGEGLSESATSTDVFMAEARRLKEKMLAEFPEEKWLYAFGEDLMPIPFFVLIEKKNGEEDKYRHEYAETLTTLHKAFYDRYQERFNLETIERPVRVVFFDSQGSYVNHRTNHPEKNYADPAFIAGYYQPWEQQLITWRQGGWRGVLFHEGTHMFVHYAFSGKGFEPSTQTPWFQEGLAEYFGGHKAESTDVDGEKKRAFQLGFFLPGRYMQYQRLKQGDERLTLRELIGVDQFRFQKAQEDQKGAREARAIVENIYATGWAFVMYLNNAHGGKYRQAFDSYFEAEVNGAGHWETMQELLGIDDAEGWEALDEDFAEWADTELTKINRVDS